MAEPEKVEQEFHDWSLKIADLLAALERIAVPTGRAEILQSAAKEIGALLEGDACGLAFLDNSRQNFTTESIWYKQSFHAPQAWSASRALADEPLAVQCIRSGRPRQANLLSPTLPLKIAQEMRLGGFQSWVFVPILDTDQQVVGLIEAVSAGTPRPFASEVIAMVELLARHLWVTLDRSAFFETNLRKAQQMTALVEAAGMVMSSLSLEEILQRVAEAMTELLPVDTCAISKYDRSQDAVLLLVEHSHFKVEKQHYRPFFLKDYPITRRVLEEKIAVQFRRADPDIDQSEHDFMVSAGVQTLIMLPLVADEQAIGLFELYCKSVARVFSAEEIDLARVLAGQAAKAIANARLYENTQRQRRLAEALAKAAESLSSSLDLNEVLDIILIQVLSVMECQAANLMLIEDGTARIVRHRGYGRYEDLPYPQTEEVRTMSVFTFSEMVRTGNPLVIQNTENNPNWVVFPGREWVKSYAAVPLLIEKKIIGFLNLDSDTPNFFDERSLEGLQAFASHATIAIQNARLFRSARQRAAELEITRKASLSLTSSLNLEDVLYLILERSLDAMPGMSGGHIFLYQDNQLIFGAGLSPRGPEKQPIATPRPDGLTALTARGKKTVLISDMRSHALVQSHPQFRQDSPDWGGSIVGIPLNYHDRVVGVMNIAHPKPNAIKAHHVRILEMLGDQAAIAIVNARLHNLVIEQARTDALTALNNRRSFDVQLAEEIQRSERYLHFFSLCMLDLKAFKLVNDTLGHPTGDRVLKAIGQALRRGIRNTDFAARYGGDEFVLILPETPFVEAVKLAERVHAAVYELNTTLDYRFAKPLDLAIGIATYPVHGATAEDLLEAADRALYRAKAAGLVIAGEDALRG